MGPTGPGPGYRASTARSSHCNTQGITFLKPRLEWVHGGFRIRGPQGPGPGLRQRKPPSPKNHPPTTKFLATSTILWLVPGGNRIGIQKSRITEWRLCLHEKNLWGGFFSNDWNAVVMAGQYPVCHFEASQTARRFQSCNLFSFPRWMDGKNAVTIFIIDI